MSRHTLSDGVTPDHAIRGDAFDTWWRELAPPARLVGDHYHRELPWEDFEEHFRSYLDGEAPRRRLKDVAALALHGDVTLLCVESTPEHCHRRLVAEAVHALYPEVQVRLR